METNINVKPWVWQWLGVLLIVFLVMGILGKVPEVRQAFKPDYPKNTIMMSAEGRVSTRPDMATTTVGVISRAGTAKDAQADSNRKTSAIVDAVKKLGVAEGDIVTSNFSVYPTYDYSGGSNNITGYEANQTLTIKIHGVDESTDTLNKVLDSSLASGNQLQGVYFGFDDPDNLKQEARKQAIEKAKQKAEELAQATGLKIGRIVSISEDPYYSSPVPYARGYDMALGQGGAGNAAVQPGTQDVIVNVTLTFEVR